MQTIATDKPSTFYIEYDDAAQVSAAIAKHGDLWYDAIDPDSVRVGIDAGNDLWVAKGTCTHLMKQHKAIVLRRYDVECDTIDGIEMCWRENYTVVNGWWE